MDDSVFRDLFDLEFVGIDWFYMIFSIFIVFVMS